MATIKLGDSDVHTVGDLPEVGSAAPSFCVTATDFTDVNSSDFAGRPVILNIFPSIATGICKASARKFNQAADEREGVTVLTVSRDLPFALEGFKAAEGIDSAVMTSAFRGDFGENYGVTMTDGGWAGLLSRAVVILDRDHRVVYTEQVPSIGQEPDYAAALDVLDGLLG